MEWRVIGKSPQKLELIECLSKEEKIKLQNAVEVFRNSSGLRNGIPVAESTCNNITNSISNNPIIIDRSIIESLSRWYNGEGANYQNGAAPAKYIFELLFPGKKLIPRWMTEDSRRKPNWRILWNEWLEQFPEEEEEKSINELNNSLKKIGTTETERHGIVKQRIKQGLFRKRVLKHCRHKCVLTGVEENPDKKNSILIASHIVAWNVATDKRLDGENGLLLAPHIDKLFDNHLISFDEYGKLIYNNYKDLELSKKIKCILDKWGVNSEIVLDSAIYSEKMKENMENHRNIFFGKNI